MRAKLRQSIPLGIISTAPGVLLGGFKTAPEFIDEEHVSIALSGRVPVNVTDENGDIKVGDRIAVSQYIDGYGTKAVHTGYTVGVALESFTQQSSSSIATSSITVFKRPTSNIEWKDKYNQIIRSSHISIWITRLFSKNGELQ